MIDAIKTFDIRNAIVTSNWIMEVDSAKCKGCGKCVQVCPVDAIELVAGENQNRKQKLAKVDKTLCLGCGVCALDCTTESLKLVPREQRVFLPEDTFEWAILQSLERGTLQNLLFNNPQSTSHGFMRAFVGGFLKLPPVKKSLMSDTLRSRFLTFMRQNR